MYLYWIICQKHAIRIRSFYGLPIYVSLSKSLHKNVNLFLMLQYRSDGGIQLRIVFVHSICKSIADIDAQFDAGKLQIFPS